MFASSFKSRRPLGRQIVSLIALSLFVGGCASPSRVPLKAEKRESFSQTKTIIGQSQQEIGADIKESNLTAAAGGGLLFALIDAGVNNSRAKKAVNSATPVRDALIGYDPGQTLATALKSELVSQPWLKLDQVEVRAVSDMKTVQGWINANTSGQLLTITPGYRLTSMCDGITINAFVRLHDAKPKSTDAPGTAGDPPGLYANTFLVFLPLPGVAPKDLPAADAARLWADNGGLKARSSLDLGFTELARMIAFDLMADAPAGKSLYKAPDGAETRDVPPVSGILLDDVKGYVVSPATAERVWVRLPAGQLVSMPK